MKKEILLEKLKFDKEYTERQIKNQVDVLRSLLDGIEHSLNSQKSMSTFDGLQGNGWRIDSLISELKVTSEFIAELEKLEEE